MKVFRLKLLASATGISATDARDQLKPMERSLNKLVKSHKELKPTKLIWESQQQGDYKDYGSLSTLHGFGIEIASWDVVDNDVLVNLTAIFEDFAKLHALEKVN
jgi:hypothetical protein